MSETQTEGPFRVGRKVPRNVYMGEQPICMVESAELAAEMVTLLNLGLAEHKRLAPSPISATSNERLEP